MAITIKPLLLVGLPLFILLRRFDALLLVAACAVGAALPWFMFLEAPRETAYGGVTAGLAVSVTAWLLRPRRHAP